MKILASEKLSQHKYKDNHGYLICTDCIMARTGKQTYTRDDCFGDGDMTEIEVDRSEKEVFDPKTLASFENVPITIEHPENNVDSDNYNSLSVGYMRDIHKGMYQGQPVMLGTAVITDSEGIEKVESGELTNLSCGYDCDITDDKNPKQTNIRGNHIALCEIPRAGITHIQDSISETRNPKKRAFLDSLARNHISYVEKEPNQFTFLTDDIGKAKRLARQIVGNNFLEDRDTLAVDFYKRSDKMKKDSQVQEIAKYEADARRQFGRLYDKIVDLEYGEFTRENPIGKTKFAKDHYWNFMFNGEHNEYFFNWLERKYPRLYAEYMRKIDENNDFEYGEDEDNALVSKEEWKEIMNKSYKDYPPYWADSDDKNSRQVYIRKAHKAKMKKDSNYVEIYDDPFSGLKVLIDSFNEQLVFFDTEEGKVLERTEAPDTYGYIGYKGVCKLYDDIIEKNWGNLHPRHKELSKERFRKAFKETLEEDDISIDDERKEKDTFMRDRRTITRRTRDEKTTWCLWTENGHIMATPKSNFGKRVSDDRWIHDLTKGGFKSIESAKRYFEKDGNIVEIHNSWTDDIVKTSKGWVNKGKEGTHGTFKTKKGAREQQKAMFARGYKADDCDYVAGDSVGEAISKFRKAYEKKSRVRDEEKIEKKVVWLDTGSAWLVPVVVENHTGDKIELEDYIGWASTKAEEVGADYVLDTEVSKNAKEDNMAEDEYIDSLERNGYVYFDRSHFGLPNIYLQLYSTKVRDISPKDDLSKAPVVKADDIVIW